jgi:hypothetical protein
MLLVIAPGAIGLSEESPAGESSKGLTKELLKMDLVSNFNKIIGGNLTMEVIL